jgi:alpha-L-fucosidase
LAIEQEERLREIAEWMFVNGEAIYGVRPWAVVNEGDTWFTKKKDTDTVYAFVRQNAPWKLGGTNDVVLSSVRATDQTAISVLGQNDKVVEYQATVPKTTWTQATDGLHIRFVQAQRLRDNRQWSDPVVLKITRAVAVTGQPAVETTGALRKTAETATLQGTVRDPGAGPEVEAGFEYRDITGQDANERTSAWQRTKLAPLNAVGDFSTDVTGLKPGSTYEIRAVARSGTQTVYGREMELSAK